MRAQGASPTRLVPDLVLHRGRFELAHPSLHPPTNLLKSIVYAMSPQAITDL